jgi:hypothetical protein
MQITKKQKIVGGVLAVVVLLSLYIIFDMRHKTDWSINNNQATTTSMTATSTAGLAVTTQGTGNYTIEQVPITEGQGVPQPIPDLKSPVVFGNDPSLTPEIKAQISQKISDLQATLSKNPKDFDSWIELGLRQKSAMDYGATVASWEYAGKLSPTNFISFGDLGDLYAYFLHDTTQSEKYYAQAIKNGPTQAYLYIQLAQIQQDIELNTSKALSTIEKGLIQIPNDPSLLQYKSTLK